MKRCLNVPTKLGRQLSSFSGMKGLLSSACCYADVIIKQFMFYYRRQHT